MLLFRIQQRNYSKEGQNQNKNKVLENEYLAPQMYCTAEFKGELPSLFVEQSLETRYWKMKHLAPHMFCTAEFRGKLPLLFVEQSLGFSLQ